MFQDFIEVLYLLILGLLPFVTDTELQRVYNYTDSGLDRDDIEIQIQKYREYIDIQIQIYIEYILKTNFGKGF